MVTAGRAEADSLGMTVLTWPVRPEAEELMLQKCYPKHGERQNTIAWMLCALNAPISTVMCMTHLSVPRQQGAQLGGSIRK